MIYAVAIMEFWVKLRFLTNFDYNEKKMIKCVRMKKLLCVFADSTVETNIIVHAVSQWLIQVSGKTICGMPTSGIPTCANSY